VRLLAGRLFNFSALNVGRCLAALGITTERKEPRQELLTSHPCIPGHLLRVSRLLLSVRPSSRWSSGRVGLKSCFARLVNLVPFGLRVAVAGFVLTGAVLNGTASVIPYVPGVTFGRVIQQPSFGWWLSELSIQACFIITLFWIAWVVSGDRKK
jgi:hypothetical protein